MDADLYDEFGNYIGPALDSDSEDEEENYERQEQDAIEYNEVVLRFISLYYLFFFFNDQIL